MAPAFRAKTAKADTKMVGSRELRSAYLHFLQGFSLV